MFKKYFNIAYILTIIVLIIFILGSMRCDNRIGKPDIRKEHKENEAPDFFWMEMEI